jgi:RNA polymerase sigma factor (sigma-70 family)
MNAIDASTAKLQALLDEGADGAQCAYDLLLSQAANRLFRLTRRMLRAYPHVRRWEETDDVFQTAAMRLHRSLADVRPPTVGAFWGLATTQIRRTLIDLARHHFGPEGGAAHHRSEPRLAAGEDAAMPEQPFSRECRPDSLHEWSEFHELVDRLPPDERDIFHLVWYAGLPQKDISELMHISLPTVQRRWYAAQMHLYELLQGERPAVDEGSHP